MNILKKPLFFIYFRLKIRLVANEMSVKDTSINQLQAMNNFKWTKLKRDFEEERCILMIGPHLASIEKDGQQMPMVNGLAEYLADYLDQEDPPIEYDPKERQNLSYIALRFLSIKGVRRVDLEDIAKDFIQHNLKKIPEVYEWLAKLPFHIIINTNKDDYIQRALIANGKQPIVHHYNFRREPTNKVDLDKMSAEHPLVYNLLGSIKETESLVLTEEDGLEFIRNVVKDNPRIPEEILGQFDDRKTYLFFGFDLENWEFRLLLDGLKLREENTTYSPKADQFPVSARNKAFYQERFNFEFIDKNATEFLGELGRRVSPTEEGPEAIKNVFLLYHQNDEDAKDALERGFSQMVSNGEIRIHYPEAFMAGTDQSDIEKTFQKSDIILTILSAHFLADPDLSGRWLQQADQLEKDGKAVLRPVIARPCDWKANPILRTRSAFPENGEALSSSFWANAEDAYFNLVQSFKKLLK